MYLCFACSERAGRIFAAEMNVSSFSQAKKKGPGINAGLCSVRFYLSAPTSRRAFLTEWNPSLCCLVEKLLPSSR